MNETVLLWFLGGLCAFVMACGGGLLAFCLQINSRVTALEIYIKTSIKGAAEVLHNDDTPNLDILLEKLVKSYHDNHYELTSDEWRELQILSEQIKNDVSREPGKRLSANSVISLAALVNDLSTHKLMRFLKP